MEFHQKPPYIFVPCFIFLLFSCSSSLSFSASVTKNNNNDSKVSLVLYYETLCPYCSNFIVNELIDIFDCDLISIVDLKLVPYGNAKIGPNETITCQHGPSECLLNTIEACGIDTWPALEDHLPFINCVETLVYRHQYTEWTQCFDKLKLDSKPIFDCYYSGYEKRLELQYAAETNALQPPHEYVPWVVVDREPLYDDYEDFVSYVCKAYKGTASTKACSDLSLKGATKKGGSPITPVSNAEKIAKPKLRTKIESAVISLMQRFSL